MFIKQIYLGKLAVFCYLVGDESTKTCALIDPAFDTGKILELAGSEGYTVTHVINTHGHADHTSGNAAVIKATNARLFIHKKDANHLTKVVNRAFTRVLGGKGSPKADVLLDDGDKIDIGKTSLTVIHTPGHSMGSICLYNEDHIFTGDTLFVGGVGRTDLPGGSSNQMLQSIQEKIYSLPGETLVWPGHNYGASPHSTISREIASNPFTRNSAY